MGNEGIARLAAQAAAQQGAVPVAQQQQPEPVTVEVHWEHPQREPETFFDVVLTFTPSGVVLRREDGSATVVAPDAYVQMEVRRTG